MLASFTYTKPLNYFATNSARMPRIFLPRYTLSSKEFHLPQLKVKTGFKKHAILNVTEIKRVVPRS
jgi:hypothetical protein